jgi:hybrid cluster-associated redox disulfide protein
MIMNEQINVPEAAETFVTKDMIVTDILDIDDEIGGLLMQMGLHCVGCLAASGEDLETAMAVHGYPPEDVDTVVDNLNSFLAYKRACRESDAASDR